MKNKKERTESSAPAGLAKKIPPRGQQPSYNLHRISRWVVSNMLRCFQLPAADGSREACSSHIDPTSPITKCEDKQTAAHRTGSVGWPGAAGKLIVAYAPGKRKGFSAEWSGNFRSGEKLPLRSRCAHWLRQSASKSIKSNILKRIKAERADSHGRCAPSE